jgi:hypothetical protein
MNIPAACPWKILAAVCVALVAALGPGPARADDAALERAFADGLGERPGADPPRLAIRRAGTSLELLAEEEGGDGLRLTCLLCTAGEQAARARQLGERISRGDEEGADLERGPDAGAGRGGLPREPVDRPSPRLPLLVGGAGLALAVAGTVLLLFDGDCASPERDAAGNCATLHDLAPTGWALAGTGAAAVAAAVLLWVFRGGPSGEPGAEVIP